MGSVPFFVLMGILAGVIPASVNAWKDPPYEGFSWKKFPRSFITGAVLGYIMHGFIWNRTVYTDNLGYIFLSIYTLERLVGETIKACFLPEVHKEYKQFFKLYRLKHDVYHLRVLMGLLFFVFMSGVFVESVYLLAKYSGIVSHSLWWGAGVGLLAGCIVAAGGALKDSPSEGFEPDKFMRSPVVGTVGGILLVGLSSRSDLLLLACIGFDRVILEGYKAYFSGKTRGMFDNMKIRNPGWKKVRHWFFITYLISVAFLLLCLSIPETIATLIPLQ